MFDIQSQLAECTNNTESGQMYQLIYGWLPESDARRKEVFVKIWKCRIAAFLEQKQSVNIFKYLIS